MTRGGRGRGSGRSGERTGSPSAGMTSNNPRWRGGSEPSSFHSRGARGAGWRGSRGAAASGRPHPRGSSKQSSAREDSGDATRHQEEAARTFF